MTLKLVSDAAPLEPELTEAERLRELVKQGATPEELQQRFREGLSRGLHQQLDMMLEQHATELEVAALSGAALRVTVMTDAAEDAGIPLSPPRKGRGPFCPKCHTTPVKRTLSAKDGTAELRCANGHHWRVDMPPPEPKRLIVDA